MAHKPKIYILDVTNRDGVQTSRICLSKLQKTMINLYLNEMGVYQSEFGFPLTHHETNYLNANLELVKKGALQPIRLSGWLRATKSDVKTAFKLVPHLKYVNLSISTSDQMIVHKFKGKLDQESVINEMVESVKEARDLGVESIGVNAEDASRTGIDYLIKFAVNAKEAGADKIRYCDTLGCDTPFSIYERVKLLAEAVNMPIEIHCHNDLGLVVANSIAGARAAVDAGVDSYINTCINGMGERAGNASLEEIVMAVKTRKDIFTGVETKIKTEHLCKISRLVSSLTGFLVAPNKAIVGYNAFRHESGIHQDGVLKERSTYEIIQPKDVGFTGSGLVLGKHSGRHALNDRLKSLGFVLTDKQLDSVATRFKALADKKKNIFDEDLVALVEDETISIRPLWNLESFMTHSGTGVAPLAEVKLKNKGKILSAKSSGDGPVDACFKAIDKITGTKGTLQDYRIEAVTSGKDAMGEVTLKLKAKGKVVTARGSSTDIIEASVRAYINALNKIESL